MLKAIKYNLSHLTDFSGRDARQTFWYYVLFIVVTQYAIAIIASIPMYVAMFGAIFSTIAENPDGVDQTAAMMDAMLDDMLGWMMVQIVISTILGVIATCLLAASFVRRLHDSGFAGWIAIIPFGAYLISLIYTVVIFDDMGEIMRETMTISADGQMADPFAMQAEMGVMSLVGWIAPILGVIFGAWPSEDGPNQYGEDSVSF